MKPKQAKFDANSWEFTQRTIRIGHNRRVKQYFKDVNSDTGVNTGRSAIKTSLLIRNADSAIETLNKMTYFANYLERDIVATYPEGWQVKKGQDIPQLVIIYRDINPKSKSGDYPLYIPHYKGTKKPVIPSYKKGDHWARWILKDNTRIIVNASTEAEALRVINKLEKHVDPKFRTSEKPWRTVGEAAKGTYKQIKVAPIRADYYSKGKHQSFAEWRTYY